VSVKVLAQQVKELQASQRNTQWAVDEVLGIFAQVIEKTDGLKLRGSVLEFHATPRSPTLGDALFNLDQEISALREMPRRGDTSKQDQRIVHATNRMGDSSPRPKGKTSTLEGLDEEIQHLRASGSNP
jgi:hypothetical protein